MIIASHLTEKQEEDLLAVLRENKKANCWTMADIKGINPSIMQHRTFLCRMPALPCYNMDIG